MTMEFFNPRKLFISKLIYKIIHPFAGILKKQVEPIPHLKEFEPQRILILEAAMLGDLIMAVPAFKAIRHRFPNSHIAFLGLAQAQEILHGETLFDEMIFLSLPWFNKKRCFKKTFDLIKILYNFRKTTWDLSLEFRGDLRNIFVLSLFKAKRRAAFVLSGGQNLLTDPVPYDSEKSHQVERNLQIAEYICGNTDERYPYIKIEEMDSLWAKEYLEGLGLNSDKRIIGLSPGTSRNFKMWPAEKWAALANLLFERGMEAVLIGDPCDKDIINKILMHSKKRITTVFLDVKRLCWFLSRLFCLVSVDSFVGHMAAAVGIKTVTLFGTNQYKYVRPYSNNGQVVVGLNPTMYVATAWVKKMASRSMISISIEQVLEKIQ